MNEVKSNFIHPSMAYFLVNINCVSDGMQSNVMISDAMSCVKSIYWISTVHRLRRSSIGRRHVKVFNSFLENSKAENMKT